MRFAKPMLVLAALLVSTAALADVVVLNDGQVYEVEGPITFDGDLVIFKLKTSGQTVSMRRFNVDENKTRSLNQVLDSDLMGLPRLRRIESIEAQRSRQMARSIPYQERRPAEEEAEIREMASTRVPVKYPAGDYPITVQPDRISVDPVGRDQAEELYAAGMRPQERSMTDYGDFQQNQERREEQRQAQEESDRERARLRAEREAEADAKNAEREQERAARAAEREAAEAEREAAREAARREQDMARAERASERNAARREKLEERAQDYRDEVDSINVEIQSAQAELRELTDLQADTEAQFEGERLRSVDAEIDRLVRQIERLESRRTRFEGRLRGVEEDIQALDEE